MRSKRTTILSYCLSGLVCFVIGGLTMNEIHAADTDEPPVHVSYVGAVYVPTSTTPSQGTVYLVTAQGQLVPAGTPFVKR